MDLPEPAPSPQTQQPADHRLYVPETDNWKAQILNTWDKVYCFSKNPGQDYYHLIVHGEIYVQRGDEVYCLNCGLRDGILTHNRLFWERSNQ